MGNSLANYVEWRSTLSADERTRWDAAIAALQPGEGLVPAIGAIGMRQDDCRDAAEPGRKILLEVLATPK